MTHTIKRRFFNNKPAIVYQSAQIIPRIDLRTPPTEEQKRAFRIKASNNLIWRAIRFFLLLVPFLALLSLFGIGSGSKNSDGGK